MYKRQPQVKSAETKSFSVGVYQVLIADLTLSFDNTIAVVAASKGNFHLMVIGLLLSVFLIATLASYFADYIKKHMWLGYLGLFVILVISIQLIIGGLVSYEVLSINEKYKFLFLPKKSCLKLFITHKSKTPPRIFIQANSNR